RADASPASPVEAQIPGTTDAAPSPPSTLPHRRTTELDRGQPAAPGDLPSRVQLTITAHALPGPAALLDPALLPGSVAVVIDLLRASTTVTRALSAGAAAVVPCLEPADALRLRDAGTHGPCILGGERR